MAKDIEEVLQKCFSPKEGKPNLRKIPVDIERARQHIDKSHKNLSLLT